MKRLSPAAFAACLALLPSLLFAAPAADVSAGAAASYQFTLGKLLAVEGSINDALAAYEQAEKLAVPESTQTAYIYVEHAQLLARMAQYARNPSQRDESLRKAGEKIAEARRLAPANLDVLRAVGDVYIDLATVDPAALATARDALEEVRQHDRTDAQSFMTLGRIYLDQNQPDKAAAVFQELVNNVPQQRMAYALLVESLVRANKPQEAEKALTDILSFDPGSLEARLSLADMQSRRGDAKAVFETLQGAPEEARADPRYQRQYAWALYQSGQLDEALKRVEPLTASKGGDTRGDNQPVLLLKGLILTAQGQTAEALALISKVRESQPKDIGLAMAVAKLQQRAGRRAEAERTLTDLSDVLAKDGKADESREMRLEAAQIAMDGKQWDQVSELLRPLLASSDPPIHQTAVLFQADVWGRAKRYDEALALLDKEKKSPAVAGRRAEVLFRAGRDAEAQHELAELAAGDDAAALAAAQSYQRAEHYQESIPILEKLAAAHPDQLADGFLLGAAYDRTGQRDRAVAELRRVLKLDPDFHAAMNYLGYTFAEAGMNLEEALALVSRAVTLDPDNGAYVDSLGWTYFRLGRTDQARGMLERAARLDPEDATLQEHLGDVYVALGQTERARQAYQRSLDLEGGNVEQVRRKLGDLDKKPRS
ncbi:MAG TPA: tetratricopeptide repeat protein [Thermoanaerobaculia bacterium]|nr:tetratricopeptide repeat protein [Thermoanaerobaculia bacterium]